MLTLVEEGQGNAAIIMPAEATEVERFAAQELARCVHLISGANLPVYLGMRESIAPVSVYVGALDHWPEVAERLESEAVPHHPQGFLLRTAPDALYLLGCTPEGALWAVYALLSEVFGVGFIGLGAQGDEMPIRTTLNVPALDRSEEPVFPYRSFLTSGNESDAPPGSNVISPLQSDRVDWMAKHRATSFLLHSGRLRADDVARHLLGDAARRGIALEWSHHNMGTWLPSKVYGRKHPEYYAVRNALRVDDTATQLCLCTSNPSVVEEVAANIVRFWEEHPWVSIVGLWPNDGYGMCECDSCAAMDRYDDETSRECAYFPDSADPVPVTEFDKNKANRYVRFLNEVTDRVVAERPDARISALFYVDLLRPAPDHELHPSIDPMVALYWRCSAHALYDPACPTNRYFAEVVDEWSAYAPGRVAFYEYYMGMGEYSALPFPILKTLEADWRAFASKGVVGACIQSAASHHVAYGLNYAAFAALSWNPDANLDEFVERWLESAYGPAAGAAGRWWRALESRMQAIARGDAPPTSDARRPRCYTPTRLNFPSLWDQDRMAEIGVALDQAAESSGLSHGQRYRLNQLRTYHTFCVASAEAYGRERKAKEAIAAGEKQEDYAAGVVEGLNRLEAFVRQVGDPTILSAQGVLNRIERIRSQWTR